MIEPDDSSVIFGFTRCDLCEYLPLNSLALSKGVRYASLALIEPPLKAIRFSVLAIMIDYGFAKNNEGG